jgi:tRNA modification GTPase
MNESADTIAAIATAAGAAGIGVVRVSGPVAPVIARALLGRAPRPRHAHLCDFRRADGELIDRGLLLWFPAPRSYTGENVLELSGHGSPVLLDLLLSRVLQLGARLARAGEFTERAFLNGKLDLAQAEAVADLIASGSETAARAALRSLEGEFSLRVHASSEAVIHLRMWIEAAIDFPEEEIDFLDEPQLGADLEALRAQLTELLAGARRGVRLADGLHAVIVGRPNAGKSSLLNALAGRERAIVTAVPGTTRDLLSERIDVDGVGITLVDTAGLHEADDAIEREGMRRARNELARADLGLLVSDNAHAATDLALLDGLPTSAARLVLHNKIDLDGSAPRRELRDGIVHLWLSAKTGLGLDLLHAELKRLAGAGESLEGGYSARARHVAALQRASEHLAAASHALRDQRAGEIAAEELRDMQRELDEITGEFTSDDLLGRIFAGFCIGK